MDRFFMPQTDSEQLTWLFIGLACLTLLVMALFNMLARRKTDKTGAKLARSQSHPRRERVATRPANSGALPPIPENLRPKAPQKPLLRGPGRPSVLIFEGAQTHESLLLLQRADSLEAEGHIPGVVYLALEGKTADGSDLPRRIADRARALMWEPDGTVARDVWWVSTGATESKGKTSGENATEVADQTRTMESDGAEDVDEFVVLRALDRCGQTMGEPLPVPFKSAELRQATEELFAHDEPGVIEILESVRTRMSALEALGNCEGALKELPQWLESLTELLKLQESEEVSHREALLETVIREVQQKKTALLSVGAVPSEAPFEALYATESTFRLAVLLRAAFSEKGAYARMLLDASSVIASEKQLEALEGSEAWDAERKACATRMKTDAADVVALLDHRIVSLGHRTRLLVRFD